jgi:2,4-dienoyl-CoA reductase-like NADH-dependent reductase (Old Yellow Enzyme family)/thioredoxin reductase
MPKHSKYPHILSPIKLGPVEIPNRVYFSPHGFHMTVGSKPSTDYAYYLRERAKGGAGLIVIALPVHDRPRGDQATPYPKANIPSFRAVADFVHEAGGRIFAETLYHWGITGSWQPMSPQAPALSPSANQFRRNTRTSSTCEMTKDDIRHIVAAFGQSTRHLREAGFDGVMVHSTHAAMLEQFLSPYFNRRTDEYGGSLENRMRLLTEVLEVSREAGGANFAVGMRFNCDELVKSGNGTDETSEILARVRETGLIDYVDLDIALEPNQYYLGFPSVFLNRHLYKPYVEAVRGAAGSLPVLSTLGRFTSIADGEEFIASGLCDMVGAARGLMAEPALVNNARDGKEEQSRTCIACNWCITARFEGAQGCTINPSSHRERFWGAGTLTPAERKSKLIVVGGGPAGLEAARVAAHRGHDVTLIEAGDRLGGGLGLWASLPGREYFQNAVDWWERELHRLGVKVQRGTRATAEIILAAKPDAVIIATGSKYAVGGQSAFDQNDIPGHTRDFVYRPEDILVKGARPSGKVIVFDCEGLHTGAGIAELLGRAGAQVTLATPEPTAVSLRLQESMEINFIMERLEQAGVTLSTSTCIRSIGSRVVTLANVHSNTERKAADVDAVVLVTGREPVNDLARELEGRVAQLFTAGDALAVRPFAAAPYEGQMFARHIGEPNAPRTVTEAFFAAPHSDHGWAPAEMLKAAK